MEFKIWNKNKQRNRRLIRISAVVFLSILLVFYIHYFTTFTGFLISLKPALIPLSAWMLFTKFYSYCLNILINFCILFALTNRLSYSLYMVYAAFAVLFIGALLMLFRDIFGLPVPLALITFFVKINKSFILLVLFIAGYISFRKKGGY